MDRQLDGQTNVQIDVQTDRQTYRQKDRQTEGQTDIPTEMHIVSKSDKKTGGTGGQTVWQRDQLSDKVSCRVVSSLQIIIFPNCIMKVGLHVHNNTLDSIGQFPSDKE